jgi:hypothetical protein
MVSASFDSTTTNLPALGGDVIISSSATGTGSSSRSIKSNRNAHQTFTISAATTLDKIYVQVSSFVAGNTYSFELLKLSGSANDAPISVTSTILSTTLDTPSGATSTGVTTYDFSDTDLTAGAYAIRFNRSGSTDVYNVFTNTTGGGAYSGGFYQETPAQSARDLGFAVAVVPEPASLAALGLGGLVAMRRRRG